MCDAFHYLQYLAKRPLPPPPMQYRELARPGRTGSEGIKRPIVLVQRDGVTPGLTIMTMIIILL